MSDPIRDAYQRKLRATDPLRARLDLPVADDEQESSESALAAARPRDVDMGNYGGPPGIGAERSPSERFSNALRSAFSRSKSAAAQIDVHESQASQMLADMDD